MAGFGLPPMIQNGYFDVFFRPAPRFVVAMLSGQENEAQSTPSQSIRNARQPESLRYSRRRVVLAPVFQFRVLSPDGTQGSGSCGQAADSVLANHAEELASVRCSHRFPFVDQRRHSGQKRSVADV